MLKKKVLVPDWVSNKYGHSSRPCTLCVNIRISVRPWSNKKFCIKFFINENTFPTAQFPDNIIYNSKGYLLHSNPLEDYFAKNPGKRPKGGIISTALWRGYVATFEIVDDELFVKDIKIQLPNETSKNIYSIKSESVLDSVFPGQARIKIDWLTGLLVIPYGKLVNYVHMGYGSTYENYILLEIEQGNLRKQKEFNDIEYQRFRERQFEAFKKTQEFKTLREKFKTRKSYTDEFFEDFLKSFIIDYTSKILID